MRRLNIVLVALIVPALALLALPSCSVADPPALTVNGWSLSRDEFLADLHKIEGSQALMGQLGLTSGSGTTNGTDKISTTTTAALLSIIVQYRLLIDEAAAKGINLDATQNGQTLRQQAEQQIDQALSGGSSATGSPTPAASDAASTFANLGPLKATLVDGTAARLGIATATGGDDAQAEDQARQFYEQQKSQFTQTCLQAILVLANAAAASSTAPQQPTDAERQAARQKAQDLKAQVEQGADFAELARTQSDDPDTASQGGNFPCASASQLSQQLPADIVQAVDPLPVGGVTDVIELSTGAALFRVRERPVQSFDAVKDQLIQTVQQSKAQTDLSDLLRRTAATAEVVVDPLFGTWERLQGQVVPPSGAASPSTISPLLGGGGQQPLVDGSEPGGQPSPTP